MRAWLVLAAVACSACGSPTQPTAPACEMNNSAELRFQNTSPSNLTFDVYVNGLRFATLSPGQVSGYTTVAAGSTHQVRFLITNTSLVACTAAPVLTRCSTLTVSCSF